jgi:hypothetical protein
MTLKPELITPDSYTAKKKSITPDVIFSLHPLQNRYIKKKILKRLMPVLWDHVSCTAWGHGI